METDRIGLLITSRLDGEPRCPNCLELMDAATGYGLPSPGDLAVCIECGSVNMYTEAMQLVRLSSEEIDGLDDRLKFQIAVFQEVVANIRAGESTRHN